MKSHLTSIICLSVIFMLLCTMCKKEEEKQNIPSEEPTVEDVSPLEAPDFSGDSAFYFVKSQTDFGPRVPNTSAHKRCADFLKKCLNKYCDSVIVQDFKADAFDGTKLNGYNIIGSFNPEKSKRIVLASHWDSRPWADEDPDEANHAKPIDGANDGASGVGVLLELARQLSIKSPEVGVDIVFFDAEDYGTNNNSLSWGLGAQYWSHNAAATGYHAEYGILLDMVGDAGAHFRFEGISYQKASAPLLKVWTTASRLGLGDIFQPQLANPITDDHSFVIEYAHIPMIDIIHQEPGTGFPKTWHTLDDNINHIDKEMLATVGKTILCVIYNEK